MAEHRQRMRSVRARTTLVASVVVAIALTVAGTVLLLLLRDRLVSAEMSAASLRSRDIATLVHDDEVPDDLSFPGEESGFSQVIGPDGTVISASENIDDEPALSTLHPPEGHSAEQIRSDLTVGDKRGRYAISARSVDSDNGTVTVVAGSSLETVDDTWTAVLVFLLIGSPLLVGLVALVTRKVVDRALTPVEAIRQQVSEITDQGLSKRVPEPGSGDEIDRLATSMNSMLSRLERSAERQRRFVADASHELRSPLASARTTLEVTQHHHEDPAAVLASIDDALIDHNRLEVLLTDLLTLARLDDPSVRSDMKPIDLGPLVTKHLSTRTDSRIRPGQVVQNAVVMGRPTQMERVLTNLTDNALTNCGDAVEVAVEVAAHDVVVRVDDDGPGIPPADRDRVFERFIRLDEARTAEGGTGLGLAIVREIVLEHGGRVEVADSAIGGASVIVHLPRMVDGRGPDRS